jgi:phage terminase large subunit-like protein
MLMFGLRLGPDPRVVVTTTPKPVKIIRELLTDPTTVVTRGSSYENRANLADAFFAQIIRKYEGTRLGRQEINAEVLDDVPGALWNRARLEELRWPAYKSVPELTRIVSQSTRPRPRARTRTKPGSSSPARTVGGAVMCSLTVPDIIRRPNGRRPQ